MMWPNSPKIYRERAFREYVQDTIVEIASTIAAFEPVILLARPKEIHHIKPLITGGVELWDISNQDLWARDAGPIFAKRGMELGVVQLQFSGWGEKHPYHKDALMAQRVAERLGLPLLPTG